MRLAELTHKIAVNFRNILSLPLNVASTIVLATYTLLWGLWLVFPFWDVFTTAPLYMGLASIMGEWAWGSIAIVCGFAMSWGILHDNSRWLERGAYIGFLHWIVISGGYFLGDWHNTGGITAFTIAALCGLTYLNNRVNRDNLPLERKQDSI